MGSSYNVHQSCDIFSHTQWPDDAFQVHQPCQVDSNLRKALDARRRYGVLSVNATTIPGKSIILQYIYECLILLCLLKPSSSGVMAVVVPSASLLYEIIGRASVMLSIH